MSRPTIEQILKRWSKLPLERQYYLLNRVFERLYKIAVGYVKKYNYCNVCEGKCGRKQDKHNGGALFCCGGCPYLGPRGCTVKAIMCRSYFCHGFQLTNEVQAKLDKLNDQIYRWGFKIFRGNKRSSITNALFNLSRISATYKQFINNYREIARNILLITNEITD